MSSQMTLQSYKYLNPSQIVQRFEPGKSVGGCGAE